MSSGHVFIRKNESPFITLKSSVLSWVISLWDRYLIVSQYSRTAVIVAMNKCFPCSDYGSVVKAVRVVIT